MLWWCFASWRLHNLHTPLIAEPDAPVSHTRGGKGGAAALATGDGGFLKWWYQTTIGFPTRNDQLWGWRLGVPPFKETPICYCRIETLHCIQPTRCSLDQLVEDFVHQQYVNWRNRGVGFLSRDSQDWKVVKFPADSVAVVKVQHVFGPVISQYVYCLPFGVVVLRLSFSLFPRLTKKVKITACKNT